MKSNLYMVYLAFTSARILICYKLKKKEAMLQITSFNDLEGTWCKFGFFFFSVENFFKKLQVSEIHYPYKYSSLTCQILLIDEI